MNILHCVHQYHPARGGAEALMKGVSDRLARRGHAVRVLATTARSTEDYFLPGRGRDLLPEGTETIDGVAVTRVPFTRFGAPVLNRLRSIASRVPFPGGDHWRALSWGPRSRAYVREILKARRVDLVVAGPLPTLVVRHAWRATRKTGVPLVVVPCFHIEDRYAFHNPRYFDWLRDAEAVICLTERERRHLHETGGVEWGKLRVVGVGIEEANDGPADGGGDRNGSGVEAARTEVRSAYGLAGRETVLFVGQHAAHKGIVQLIEAMETVWRRTDRDADLVVAGNPTAYTAVIEERIGRLPEALRKRVRLIKGIDEVEKRRLLRAADVFVSVSPYESFGIVYLEAWRERRAVIGCRRGASAEIIENHRDGLLVSDGESGELAGAILDLLDDPELRRRMGERGSAKVRDRFSWDRIADAWEEVYRDVVR